MPDDRIAAAVIGRSPDLLTLAEREVLIGQWIALEIYSPETLPLRKIEAIGRTQAECVRQLIERGLDASKFEFVLLGPPW